MRGQQIVAIAVVLGTSGCFHVGGCRPDDEPEPPPADLAIPADLAPCTEDHCACANDAHCGGGRVCCNSQCVDVLSDPDHCGGCDVRCPSGQCLNANGSAFCSCAANSDGGGIDDSLCTNPLMPDCSPNGVCSCGRSPTTMCSTRVASACEAGSCECAGGPSCSPRTSDRCDPVAGCRCGSSPACDPATSNSCARGGSSNEASCRCGSRDACAAGTTCCTQNSSCCQPGQYCCLDGCCNHPCLVFGFCAQ